MKLSEAIRRGVNSGLVEEKTSSYLDDDGACVLGMAYVGVTGKTGYLTRDVLFQALQKEFPIMSKKVGLPCKCEESYSPGEYFFFPAFKSNMLQTINHLHCCRWSAKAIAEWVETVENGLETVAKMETEKVEGVDMEVH